MTPLELTARLRVGDVLLYAPVGLFGWLIRFHTGSATCAHVEVYVGGGWSVAARDGQGVGRYPLRLSSLSYVLRPSVPFNLDGAIDWFDAHKGEPYSWIDLANFCGIPINTKGMVCSPCATYVLRAGGVPVFGDVPAESIEPRDFRLSDVLVDVTASVTGQLSPRVAAGSVPVPAGSPI